MAILILFFCSGATALVYEVLWSKYMALLFGSTIQAQTVVLAVFMGGLALGNKLFSRHADRARHPLAIYGKIELAIGVYAMLFPWLYSIAGNIFASVGSTLLDKSSFLLLLLKGILALALLLGPTVLMGGTLPILAAWLQRFMSDAGRGSARFYAINSFGAVCGAALSGFWLVQQYGLSHTVRLSAVVNLVIGVSALAIGRKYVVDVPPEAAVPDAPTTAAPALTQAAFRRGCLMVAATGAVSMGLEVLASRCLCLIFGGSLQTFAIVLIAFILGISVGSSLIASPNRKQRSGEGLAIVLFLVGAVLIGLVVCNVENLIGYYIKAQSGLFRNPMGYAFSQVLTGVAAIFVLGLPAAVLGSVLPLWIRSASDSSHLLGDRVGRLLTWNTIGAVIGSLLTGFIIMPLIGLRGAFTTLAAVLVIAAIVVAIQRREVFVVGFGVVAGIFLMFAAGHDAMAWREFLSAGVFRMSDFNFTMNELRQRSGLIHLDFYEDAADATVSVESINGSTERSLRVNGKVDASSTGDGSTQLMLAYLPLMVRPEAKEVFCFGMGSGITAGAALNYPIEHLTVAENCEPVLRAAALFNQWNNGVLTNARTRIYSEDARTALRLSTNQYDVIVSEPSNPWMIGVPSVFTREFYQFAAKRLRPGGIMVQWFHTYEMDNFDADLVLRTFGSVFPNMEIWDAGQGDIIVLGSDKPWKSDPEVYQHAFENEKVRRNLATIGINSGVAMMARRMASQRTAFAISGPGPLQMDDHPILEYTAPEMFYIYLHRIGVSHLQRYDERTWEMELASDKANTDLSTLSPQDLKMIFDMGQGCANEDLLTYLHNIAGAAEGKGQARPVIQNNHAMLCSLQGTNKAFGVYTPPSAATNMLTRQLAGAEFALRANDKDPKAIDDIQGALDAVLYYQPTPDWAPDYYAELGVEAALRANEPEKAKKILLRAAHLQPSSDSLGYLARILLREGILKPADFNLGNSR